MAEINNQIVFPGIGMSFARNLDRNSAVSGQIFVKH